MSQTEAPDAGANGRGPDGPCNLEAERALLGCLLLDGTSLAGVALEAADFALAAHRDIYAALRRVAERGAPPDHVAVAAELERMGVLDGAGGRAYLWGLRAAVPSASGASHYARLVADCAILRRLVHSGQRIVALGYDGAQGAQDTWRAAQALLDGSGPVALQEELVPVREVLPRYLSALEQRAAQHSPTGSGVPTDLIDLDKALGGLHSGDLLLLAARPAIGKTAMMLTICRNAARKGHRCAIFSMEMGAEQVVGRLLSMEAAVDGTRLRDGFVSADEWSRLVAAAERLDALELYVDETSTLTPAEMGRRVRTLHARLPVSLVTLDYLQLMHSGGPRAENRVQEITAISRDLKALARDLGVPVLALSQLSRAVELRADHRPQLSDLRESGSQEQDADVVLLLYREKTNIEGANPCLTEVHVAKNRNGTEDKVRLYFHQQHTTFLNWRDE